MTDLSLSNIYRNAPFAIATYYGSMGVFTLLMTAIFVNSTALRDFSYNTYQLMFSTPVRRRDLLLGRFFGATLISVIPMLGVSLGILLAKYLPWVNRERWEPVNWTAHLRAILLFVVLTLLSQPPFCLLWQWYGAGTSLRLLGQFCCS